MSDLEQARELVEAAERDLSALRGMGDADVFADPLAALRGATKGLDGKRQVK